MTEGTEGYKVGNMGGSRGPSAGCELGITVRLTDENLLTHHQTHTHRI